MPERNPRRLHRRSPAAGSGNTSRGRQANSSSRKSIIRLAKPPKLLRRTSSEPILWIVQFLQGESDSGSSAGAGSSEIAGAGFLLPSPFSFYDVFDPDLLRSASASSIARPSTGDHEEVKVVVNVTVEGSPGPVKAMVRLGASVEEAIGLVVDKYRREGRTPKLDPASAAAFQLHHSHFSLQSLNKKERIGETGARSFYLRRNSGSASSFGSESSFSATSHKGGSGSEFELAKISPAHDPHFIMFSFMCIMARKMLAKLGRRTTRLWRVILCNCF